MHDPTTPQSEPLSEALENTKQATEAVKDAVDDLAVIHAVLSTDLPAEVRQGDAGAAIEQAKGVEKQLSESAELLDQAKEQIGREIKERKKKPRRSR